MSRLFYRRVSPVYSNTNEPKRRVRRQFLNQFNKRPTRRLHLEALEGRRVLAVYIVNDPIDQIAEDGLVSLREAILAANQNSQNADTINGGQEGDIIRFNLGAGNETITLTSSLPAIEDDLVIDGDNTDGSGVDITISGNNAFGIFAIDISQANVLGDGVDHVILQRLTLRDANRPSGGGAVFNNTAGGDEGFNSTLFINQVTFLNNTAGSGGAILSSNDNIDPTILSLDVNGGVFIDNAAANSLLPADPIANSGGAITLGAFTQGTVNRQVNARIQDSVFTGNSATGLQDDQGGGAIYVDALSSLTISDALGDVNIGGDVVGEQNTAQNGGGIMSAGTLVIFDTNANNVNIGGNSAARVGGGIEVFNGTATISGVSLGASPGFVGNTAVEQGGGLHSSGTSNVTITGGTVSANSANIGGGLYFDLGTMIVDAVTVSGNTAAINAGGIANVGDLTIRNGSLISGNTASANAGGIFNQTNMLIENSTVTTNSSSGLGGGITTASGSVTTIQANSTISSNTGNTGGGIANQGTLTIFASNITGNTAGAEGGGIWNALTGNLVLDDATGSIAISNNVANGNVDASGDLAFLQGGGGIFNDGNIGGAGGTVTILDNSPMNVVAITGNQAAGLGGLGLTAGSGGGILSIGGNVNITGARITNNEAVRAGGGIELVGGTASVVDTTIDGNDVSAAGGAILSSAPGNGGGIHTSDAAAVTIDGSTISNNTAEEGGGLWNSATGTFTVTNSTISTNVAASSGGGGVFNVANGVVSLDSVTITLNSATTGGGIAGGTGGVTLRNTIVAQNTVSGGEQNLSGGPIGNTGFNLIGDPDDGTLTPSSVTNIFDALDAQLGPLQDNGGPTFTHRPLPGSPAIGFGDTVLTVDQRNIARPQGGNDDIGAVEIDLVGVEISAGVGAGDGNPDVFRIINGPGPNDVTVEVNGVAQIFDATLTGQLRIFGSSDDDTLTVDNSNGLIGQQIIFFGDGGMTVGIPQVPQGAGFDKLQLVGTTPADTIYNPGETNDAGAVFQTAGGLTQRVEFFGLEPVEVRGTGAGDTLFVASQALGAGFPQALNAANAINYSEGPNSNDPFNPVFLGDLTGLVTVDGFEGLEFSNFGSLVIDAGAGSDEINLNNPAIPTALTTIEVHGGDPTGSDTLIINGRSGLQDQIRLAPTGAGAGTITQTGLPNRVFTGIEHIRAVMDPLVSDHFTVDGTAGDDHFRITSGPATGEQVITGEMNEGAGGPFLLPTIHVTGQSSTLVGTFNFNGAGGTDQLTITGTNTNDVFSFARSTATSGSVDHDVDGQPTNFIGVVNFANIVVEGGNGDDLFVVPGNFPIALQVNGGNPASGSDILQINGVDGVDDTFTVSPAFDPGAGTVAVNGASTSYTGIEHVQLFGRDADQDNLIVNDDARDNTWSVFPGPVFGDRIEIAGRETIDFNDFTDVTLNNGFGADAFHVYPTNLVGYGGTLTINGDPGTPLDDQIILHGTEGNDVVTSTATTIAFNGVSITVGANIRELRILALGGADHIDLDLDLPGMAQTHKYIDAGDGDDIVNMSGTVDATILGGAGDDFLTGSPTYDYIDGGAGNDFIFGLAGNDDLYGGEGSDLIVGGAGADRMFGQAGADVLVWNPGDGSDLFEGGEGSDILQFVGGGAADTFTLTANGTRLRFDRQPGNVVIDAGGIEQVDINSSIAFGGTLSGVNVVPPVVTAAVGQTALVFNSVTNTFELEIVLQGITQANLTASSINLGALGVNGAVIFDLGAGAAWNDVGGSLRRTVNLGAFPAANVADLLAGNTYVQVTTVGNTDDVRAQLTPVSGAPNLNGADTFTVNDLAPTEVQVVNLGLGVDDLDALDTVTINGRNVSDNISIAATSPTRVAVTGLAYDVNIDGALTAAGGDTSDILIVNGNDGNDTITSPGSLLAFFTNENLRLNGGLGNDNILANGATMSGGAGDDFLTGGTNDDIMDGGEGDDTFVGGGGTDNVGGGVAASVGDTILVAGTSGADTVRLSLSATGQLIATVNGATTTYNNFVGGPIGASGIEQILVQTQNGNDVLTVDSANGAIPILVTYDGGANNDLLTLTGGTATADTYSVGPELNRGTSVIVIGGVTQQVSFVNIEPVIDLVAGPLVVQGTNANNTITYTQGPNVGAPVANTGLVAIDGFETIEFGNKTALTINALQGNDTVTLANTGAAAPTGLTQIIVTGGDGDDVIDAGPSTVATPLRLYGGTGNDTLIGGLAGDLLYGEQGNDTLVDSPGNDAFDGGNNGAVPAGFVFPALPAGVTLPAPTSDPITATGGFDVLVVRGTGGNDVLAVTQGTAPAVAGAGYPLAIVNSAGGAVPPPTADVITTVGAADVPNAVASRPSVEEVRIEAGNGNDEIIVAHADSYVAATGTGAAPVLAPGAVPQQMVRFDVRGDSPNASDRLTVQDLGLGDLVLLRQAVDQRTGRITVAPAVNTTTLAGFHGDVVYTGIEKVNITPINPLNGGTGTDGLGQVIVFDTDPFEYNDNILSAEDIAHIELVTRTPNIDPGHNGVLPVVTPAGNGDEDWYAFTATKNGTFQINTLFTAVPNAQPTVPGTRPGLPGDGQLTSALYNAIGPATAPLVVGSPLLDSQGQLVGQQLSFTAIEGVTYYLRIVGLNATPDGLPAVGSTSTSLAINTYDITIAETDNLGPQVFDPDGPLFPAQAVQIVDAPLYNLFDNKQTFNSTVSGAPAPTLVGGVLTFTSNFNLVGMHVGETVTFTTGVNAGLSDKITAINGDSVQFGSAANPTVFALPAVGDAFFVGAPAPTPNVNGLIINFRDPITASQLGLSPGALLGALDPATALNPGNYEVRGDANGIIPIQNVRFAVPATGVIGGAVLAPTPDALNTTISLNAGAGLSVANGPIVGQTLQFTTGPNSGLYGRITGYNSLTGSLRFASPFPFAISTGDAFIISPSPIVISPIPVLATANVTAAGSNTVISLGAGAVTGAGLSDVPGTYVGQALQIVSGPLAGETRTITAYNGAGVFTVAGGVPANGFSAAPGIGDVFNIVGTPATATSAVTAGPPLSNASFNGGLALPAVNNTFVGQAVQFTSGSLAGQARVVTGYNGATRTFSFDTPFTGAPAVGDQFVIVPNAPAATSGTVTVSGTLTLTANPAGLSLVQGAYVGQILQFTSGALTGQAQLITSYDGAGSFTFANPFGAGMAAGDTFNILPVNVASIILDFEGPLPDDRYTLTVSDEIRDFAGNRLDGNSNASQPTGSPTFPSGDGFNGGDFVARFTVDSRPELGTWAAGSVWIDINGNQVFDPTNTDFTNRDFAYLLGYTSDELFAGNFADVSGTFADGFDKLGAYGRVGTNTWRWLIDTDNDGVPNINQIDPAGINGFPVSGDFDPTRPGDEVGLFTGTTWYLDINGNYILNDGPLGVRQLPWTFNGEQVHGYGFTGDFDGDGAVDLGTWSNDVFSLSLSSLSGGVVDGVIDTQFTFGFPGNRERPVAADMNGDGIDDIGLWVPDRTTQSPSEGAEWYWLVSGLVTNDTPLPGGLPPFPATLGPTIPERVVADPVAVPGRNIVAFTPAPFGNDLYMQFGDEFSLPIVGNFDPPIQQPTTNGFTNVNNPLDVNNDGKISAFDALVIINELNLNGGPLAAPAGGFIRAPFLDVNGNGQITAFDALQVINYLNLHPLVGASEYIFENGLDQSGGEDTSGVDDELLALLAADKDRN